MCVDGANDRAPKALGFLYSHQLWPSGVGGVTQGNLSTPRPGAAATFPSSRKDSSSSAFFFFPN